MAIQARKNCEDKRNKVGEEWFDRWSNLIEQIEQNHLPSGSGFDCGTKVDIEKSNVGKIVLVTSYHHMNQNGMYDGWTEHTITVKPSFTGFDMKISGRDRDGLKEYMHEVFYSALSAECEAKA